MDKIKEDWFDHLQVNFLQAPEGFLGIHAHKLGYGCVYFEVPMAWMKSDDFFGLVHEQALKEWAMNEIKKDTDLLNPIKEKCPVCKHSMMAFHFRYKGRFFCRYCGAHYEVVNHKVIITRRLDV